MEATCCVRFHLETNPASFFILSETQTHDVPECSSAVSCCAAGVCADLDICYVALRSGNIYSIIWCTLMSRLNVCFASEESLTHTLVHLLFTVKVRFSMSTLYSSCVFMDRHCMLFKASMCNFSTGQLWHETWTPYVQRTLSRWREFDFRTEICH